MRQSLNSAMAMTDHGVMYDAIEFYQAARNRHQTHHRMRGVCGSRQPAGEKSSIGGKEVYNHLVLLAQGQRATESGPFGFNAHLEGYYYKPRIDKEILGL